jgi:hypothetical protein
MYAAIFLAILFSVARAINTHVPLEFPPPGSTQLDTHLWHLGDKNGMRGFAFVRHSGENLTEFMGDANDAFSEAFASEAPWNVTISSRRWRQQGSATEKRAVPTPTSCGSVIAPGFRWKVPHARYSIDYTNPEGLSHSFIASAIDYCIARQWQPLLSFPLWVHDDGIGIGTSVSVPDGRNTLSFRLLPTASNSIIAFTTAWGKVDGTVADRYVSENDIVFNTHWKFGDAYISGRNVVDLVEIACHELGHAWGLGHPPKTTECSGDTMYPTASKGEIKKRTVSNDDRLELCNLYQEANCGALSSDTDATFDVLLGRGSTRRTNGSTVLIPSILFSVVCVLVSMYIVR